MRPFTFVLSHAGGESVVLAAESEKEMHEWMQAVRTSRMCVADAQAASMIEDARRTSAEAELDSALEMRSNPEEELSQLNAELDAVQAEHRQLEVEKETAEKQLKELMARFKLRKALLHWRHRKLTLSFHSLVTMVFRTRIEEARRLKESSDKRMGTMESEMGRASADRQRAEAAKRKSDEMLTKELALRRSTRPSSRTRRSSSSRTRSARRSLRSAWLSCRRRVARNRSGQGRRTSCWPSWRSYTRSPRRRTSSASASSARSETRPPSTRRVLLRREEKARRRAREHERDGGELQLKARSGLISIWRNPRRRRARPG